MTIFNTICASGMFRMSNSLNLGHLQSFPMLRIVTSETHSWSLDGTTARPGTGTLPRRHAIGPSTHAQYLHIDLVIASPNISCHVLSGCGGTACRQQAVDPTTACLETSVLQRHVLPCEIHFCAPEHARHRCTGHCTPFGCAQFCGRTQRKHTRGTS